MTEPSGSGTIEERLVRVETKTDLLRKDLDEFKAETRSGFDAVRSDMRQMEVRLCARQDRAVAELRSEFRDTTDSLREEIKGSADGLRKEIEGSADGLRKEIEGSADGLRKEINGATESLTASIAELRGYFKIFIVATVSTSLGVLALVANLIVRG